MKTLIENTIQSALARLEEAGELPKGLDIHIQVERCREKKFGHFSSNIAMMLAKPLEKAPYDLAVEIVNLCPPSEQIAQIKIAGPGFINFFLAEDALQSIVKTALDLGDAFGTWDTHQGQRVHLEYVSANPTGPLHVGHGRSAAFGACVANLLTAVGYQVHSEYYVNDAGRQVRILALSTWLRYLELWGETIKLPKKAYQGQYIIDIAKRLKDQYQQQYVRPFTAIEETLPKDHPSLNNEEVFIDAMVEAMITLIGNSGFSIFHKTALEAIVSDIKNDLTEFDVIFETWFRESHLVKEGLLEKGIERLQSQNHVFEKDGALWFRATDFGDEKDRVLLRANGTPTYFAADIAYHLYKFEQGYDRIIDIFGADHHGYIERIKGFLKGLGKDPKKLDILLVQFAILYRGAEKIAMSTRSGEFVTLRELRNEVGNDAARYFYIMRKPAQHLEFDLELAKSHDSDNPVYYIQYAHARICSVWNQLKNSDAAAWDKANGLANIALLTQDTEKNLLNKLCQYPEIILNAATHQEPHAVANFLLNFANLFHSYYNSSRFLVKSINLRDARLCLIAAVKQTLKNGLNLLGLSAPESM